MKNYLHVNYYEGPGKLEGLFALAEANEYEGVELRYKYVHPDMTQDEYKKNANSSLKLTHFSRKKLTHLLTIIYESFMSSIFSFIL